jgi:hypothetical protein
LVFEELFEGVGGCGWVSRVAAPVGEVVSGGEGVWVIGAQHA